MCIIFKMENSTCIYYDGEEGEAKIQNSHLLESNPPHPGTHDSKRNSKIKEQNSTPTTTTTNVPIQIISPHKFSINFIDLPPMAFIVLLPISSSEYDDLNGRWIFQNIHYEKVVSALQSLSPPVQLVEFPQETNHVPSYKSDQPVMLKSPLNIDSVVVDEKVESSWFINKTALQKEPSPNSNMAPITVGISEVSTTSPAPAPQQMVSLEFPQLPKSSQIFSSKSYLDLKLSSNMTTSPPQSSSSVKNEETLHLQEPQSQIPSNNNNQTNCWVKHQQTRNILIQPKHEYQNKTKFKKFIIIPTQRLNMKRFMIEFIHLPPKALEILYQIPRSYCDRKIKIWHCPNILYNRVVKELTSWNQLIVVVHPPGIIPQKPVNGLPSLPKGLQPVIPLASPPFINLPILICRPDEQPSIPKPTIRSPGQQQMCSINLNFIPRVVDKRLKKIHGSCHDRNLGQYKFLTESIPQVNKILNSLHPKLYLGDLPTSKKLQILSSSSSESTITTVMIDVLTMDCPNPFRIMHKKIKNDQILENDEDDRDWA